MVGADLALPDGNPMDRGRRARPPRARPPDRAVAAASQPDAAQGDQASRGRLWPIADVAPASALGDRTGRRSGGPAATDTRFGECRRSTPREPDVVYATLGSGRGRFRTLLCRRLVGCEMVGPAGAVPPPHPRSVLIRVPAGGCGRRWWRRAWSSLAVTRRGGEEQHKRRKREAACRRDGQVQAPADRRDLDPFSEQIRARVLADSCRRRISRSRSRRLRRGKRRWQRRAFHSRNPRAQRDTARQ